MCIRDSGGDIDQGAKVMENMMKHLEAGGPYERLGTYGSGVASLFSGNAPFGNQSTITPNPTPLQTALGTGLVLSEIFDPQGRRIPQGATNYS